MISFSNLDLIIVLLFFAVVLLIGFIAGKKKNQTSEDYLLYGRNVGLSLFVLTNVSTWYGGILGVGEFTYRYGIVSWFTQGLPYYIFAIIFAFLFAGKIREASLFTIPDKIESVYGKKASIVVSVLIFVLVSPAPYLLMMGNIISLIFHINIFYSLLLSLVLSIVYLFRGGYRSDVYTDAFEFFVMFIGFFIIIIAAIFYSGDLNYLKEYLPPQHLNITGGTSITYIVVWFLIALWTFTDPGFHQRCYAAKSKYVAKWGIIISVGFWALFDFLTTGTGLYARAILPHIENPVLAFPLLAEKILLPGYKGIFYAALIATILSTLNSFLFLSATTFSRDFVFKLSFLRSESNLKRNTVYGLLVSGLLSLTLAYFIPSVIELWYTIGSLCIPGLVLLVISAYYPKIRVNSRWAMIEMICAVLISSAWYYIRGSINRNFLSEIEPMIAGLTAAVIIHIMGIIISRRTQVRT